MLGGLMYFLPKTAKTTFSKFEIKGKKTFLGSHFLAIRIWSLDEYSQIFLRTSYDHSWAEIPHLWSNSNILGHCILVCDFDRKMISSSFVNIHPAWFLNLVCAIKLFPNHYWCHNIKSYSICHGHIYTGEWETRRGSSLQYASTNVCGEIG